MLNHIFTRIIPCFAVICFAAKPDEFYIFSVGQGNCQVAKYYNDVTEDYVAFMYDCGSSENCPDEKLHVPLANQGWFPFCEKVESNVISKIPEELITKISESFSQLFVTKSKESTRKLNESRVASRKRGISDQDKEDQYKEIASSLSDVNSLILFLSHPDTDHFNKVEKVLKGFDKSKVHAFVCGDWKSKGNPAAINTYTYFKDNKITVYEPYMNEETKAFKGGSLFKLLKKYNALENFKLLGMNTKILDKVNIFSMNTDFKNSDDQNAASPVISFNVNDVSFICTGDAEGTTFENVKKEQDMLSKLQSEIVCIAPHHGSGSEESLAALSEMCEFFNPNALVVSAGSGSTHPHPHSGFVNVLRPHNDIGKKTKERYKTFSYKEKFTLPLSYNFDKKFAKNPHVSYNCPYIWSTYYNGSIQFDGESFNINGNTILRNFDNGNYALTYDALIKKLDVSSNRANGFFTVDWSRREQNIGENYRIIEAGLYTQWNKLIISNDFIDGKCDFIYVGIMRDNELAHYKCTFISYEFIFEVSADRMQKEAIEEIRKSKLEEEKRDRLISGSEEIRKSSYLDSVILSKEVTDRLSKEKEARDRVLRGSEEIKPYTEHELREMMSREKHERERHCASLNRSPFSAQQTSLFRRDVQQQSSSSSNTVVNADSILRARRESERGALAGAGRLGI